MPADSFSPCATAGEARVCHEDQRRESQLSARSRLHACNPLCVDAVKCKHVRTQASFVYRLYPLPTHVPPHVFHLRRHLSALSLVSFGANENYLELEGGNDQRKLKTKRPAQYLKQTNAIAPRHEWRNSDCGTATLTATRRTTSSDSRSMTLRISFENLANFLPALPCAAK